MGWLDLADRSVLVTGLANKKSVAWRVGQGLRAEGARVLWAVHSAQRAESVAKLVVDEPVFACDVERQEEVEALRDALAARGEALAGLLHSIAFADYSGGPRRFHETAPEDFLRAVDVSCFSLVRLANALKELFAPAASVVTISISDTSMAAENYGPMGPVKAALDSAVAFLAKSFSELGGVRFNAVKAGLLKTQSSAGIPGYLESWLYGEAATLRKRGLTTQEVADCALFLLSPRSSGVNGRGLVVDAGMGLNYFDRDIVRRVATPEEPR